jgi:subtilisin family serine protease
MDLRALHFARFTDAARDSDSSHGSAVAGIIAGRPERGIPGLLPESTLYSADVVGTDGRGNAYGTAEAMARGIDWLLAKSLDAINISMNGSANPLVEKAVASAADQGVPVIAAVGNDGNSSEPSYPAAYPSVIAVTAVDARRRLYGSANRGEYVAIAAPGVNVWTPSLGGGEYRTGTSFAAPFVTAAAALLHHGGIATGDALEQRLVERTLDLGPAGRDPLYGWGLIQGDGLCR